MKWVILGLIGFAFLKIWRGSGYSRHEGMTLWQYLYEGTRTLGDGEFGHPHIPIEEARQRARQTFIERFQVSS